MRSAMLLGTACMLDGMAERFEEELGYPMQVIATGGLARLVTPLCRREIILDDKLLLKGLREIYRRSDVHIYTDSDVVLSCNKSWLMLHTARGADCTVRLPRKASRILEVTTETPVAENTDTFTWRLPDRSTAVFLLEPPSFLGDEIRD